MLLMILLTVQNIGSAMADVVADAMIAEAVRSERYVCSCYVLFLVARIGSKLSELKSSYGEHGLHIAYCCQLALLCLLRCINIRLLQIICLRSVE